ncbi:MAG: transporter substrate-binding domain-containing protein [Chloroflexi bacterium]|nr:transporter substrate-binding domain-containing protein [Chloroflexota bacterium]
MYCKKNCTDLIFKTIRPLIFICLLSVVTTTAVRPIAAQENVVVNLTDAEKAWLAEHPTIRIGVDPEYAPYSFVDDNGQYVGVAMDFVDLISEQLGVSLEVVPGLTWPEIVEGARNREVDIIITAVQTDERDQFLDFTEIYIPTPLVIMIRVDDSTLKAPEDLAGKTVALVDGYSSSERVLREHPTIEPLLVENPLEGLVAVSSGAADAYVGVLGINLYLASNYGVQNLQIATNYDLQGNGQRLASRNDWPELAPILEKTLKAIPEEQKSQIFQKWIPVQSAESPSNSANSLILSAKESAWLAEHPIIRVAADPNYAPIAFTDGRGQFQGVAIDYLAQISDLLGVEFEITQTGTWDEVASRLENQEFDLFATAVPTPDQRQTSSFTSPYLTLPAVIFTHEDVSFIGDLSQLNGERVTAVKGFAVTEFLKRDYPEIELIETDDVAAALDPLTRKEAVAYIGSILTTGYYLRQGGYQNLKVSGQTPYQIELTLATRSDWPVLAALLQKSLDSLAQEEHEAISRKWATIQIAQAINFRQIAFVGLAGISIVLLFTGWNMSLRREVSKRKQTEEALRQAKETAENAQSEAETANRAKSAFLANMSHELRTPLNAILGFARLMMRDATMSSKSQKNLNIINDSGEHLLGLINDVLDMSKIEAGHVSLYNSKFDLQQLLNDLEAMLHMRAQRKGLHLVFDLAPNLPRHIEGDEKRLRQVLINLLNNGIKFTEQGTVSLRVSPLPQLIEANGRDTARLAFTISDTGVGIAPEEIGQVFAAFTQTKSGRQSGEGTGLGLPISRQFVRLMGGDIAVQSQEGQGATFTFDIQVRLAQAEEISEPEPAREVIGLADDQEVYRILVVDDVAENRAILQTLLQTIGFSVQEAADGQAALDTWKSWQPHLIWMDIRMPVMDGMTATRHIKQAEVNTTSQTIVIALSSSVLDEERELVLAAGADDFVPKPFAEAEIFGKMATYLGVRYLYADLPQTAVPTTSAVSKTNPPVLTPELLLSLKTAVKHLDMENIDSNIEDISAVNPALAHTLSELASDFQYGDMLSLIDETRNELAADSH